MTPRNFVILLPFLLALATADRAQPIVLSPQARQTASLLGISGEVDSFAALRTAPLSTGTTLRGLVLRQQIMESLFEAKLDVDSAIALIQKERDQIQEARELLSEKREGRGHIVEMAATIFDAGSAVGDAIQFNDKLTTKGNAVTFSAGAVAAALSLWALHLQHGGKTRVEVAPNMLARLFGRPTEPANIWPGEVWAYLNSAPASGLMDQTRAEVLKHQWVKQGRISLQPSLKAEQKIVFLTSSLSGARRLSAGELSDRAAMLADLRAQVALTDRDIAELVHCLRQAGW
jgi:hypothetical protein